jgi:hypothetical protein
MKTYVLTVKSHPWLMSSIEDALLEADATVESDPASLARRAPGPGRRPVSDDEVLVALNALCDLGVIERDGRRYRLNRARLDATDQVRRSVHETVRVLRGNVPDSSVDVQLCASLPPSLSPAAEHVIHESSTDLRSSLVDIVASAKRSLILASPFWDKDTTAEIVSLARKKLEAGVHVTLLGRFSRDLAPDVKGELSRIAKASHCAILSWFEGSGEKTQTFHFKAVSADHGLRAYIGSANMTFSSLRSRMELGVVLTGNPALQLDRILRVVITMATPVPM